MTATFSVLLAVSSAVPPSLAIPVADAVHWRVSIGWWGLVALAAALPWIAIRPDKDLQDYEKAVRVKHPSDSAANTPNTG
jgi:cyanate permease